MEWRDIPGCPGYQATACGRVRSFHRIGPGGIGDTPRDMAVVQQVRGGVASYQTVQLRVDGKRRLKYVHDLVLSAFVGPRPDGMQACHNNGDPTDNRLANLRWDTPTANQRDRRKHGTFHGRHGNKLSPGEVRAIRARIRAGDVQRSIADRFGVAPQVITDIKQGKAYAWVAA